MYKKELNIGDKFQDWTVLEALDKRHHGHLVYKVKCICGYTTEFSGYYLRSGKSKCCRSCSATERTPKGENHRLFKHGATLQGRKERSTYKVWVTMRQRCNDPNSRDYPNYGGRGIFVCPEWDDFQVFLKDMGICPTGLSLDRIDNQGNYNKENCAWVSRKVQNNNRRNNTTFLIDGKKVTRTQIQEVLCLTRDMYRRRFESKGIDWILEEYKKRSE